MPGYFFSAFDEKKKQPLGSCGIHDGDWCELTQLAVDLRDAAESDEPLDGASRAPSAAEVEKLPPFDPEQFVLLGEDPRWKEYGDGGGARWCSAATVAAYAKAMRALDACVGTHSAREAWARYLSAVEALAGNKQGLYCSTDE